MTDLLRLFGRHRNQTIKNKYKQQPSRRHNKLRSSSSFTKWRSALCHLSIGTFMTTDLDRSQLTVLLCYTVEPPWLVAVSDEPLWLVVNISDVMFYSVSQKNTPDIFSCNLNKYFPISIIFGTSIT